MSPDEPRRFVPKGVDAQSWLGFEQRIQDRRYKVLIETARAAILVGDVSNARAAIDEARELRPADEELESLECSLDSQPPVVLPVDTPFFRSRAFGAAAMLVVGISLVSTIDYMRSEGTARVVSAPTMRLPGLQVPLPPVGDIPLPTSGLRSLQPVIPTGAASLDATPNRDVNVPASIRASATAIAETAPLRSGEVPDDFVYPSVRPAPTSSPSRPVAAVVVEPSVDRPQPAGNMSVATAPVLAAPLTTPTPIPGTPGSLPPARVMPAGSSPPASPGVSGTTALEGPSPSVASASARAVVNPPATTQAALTPSPSATLSASRPAATIRPASAVNDDARVADVLNAYARAYGDLDAAAARVVWPSVDERALARAFSTLSSQTVSFADCQIDVEGASALASCRGYASYVGKIGSGGTRTEPRQWRFELRRVGDDWRIQNAVVGSRQ